MIWVNPVRDPLAHLGTVHVHADVPSSSMARYTEGDKAPDALPPTSARRPRGTTEVDRTHPVAGPRVLMTLLRETFVTRIDIQPSPAAR